MGGVTTQLVPCGDVERNRGATGRGESESRLFLALEIEVTDAKRGRGEHPYVHRRRTMPPTGMEGRAGIGAAIVHRGWPRP